MTSGKRTRLATGAMSRMKLKLSLSYRVALIAFRRTEEEEERIPVGGRTYGGLRSDIAAGTRPVLNDELLAEPLRQPLTHQAREDVERAAPRRLPTTESAAAALPAVSLVAKAQAFPTRPVRIIVGFPARASERLAPATRSCFRPPSGTTGSAARGRAFHESGQQDVPCSHCDPLAP
jgi:hypothetical protein